MPIENPPTKQQIDDIKTLNKQANLLLENADEAFYYYSIDGKLIYVNSAFQTITGYTTQELYEKNFIPFVHPDDQEWTMELWEKLYEGEFFEDVEYRIVRKDGAVRWCLSTWKMILDKDGVQIGIQGKQEDITRRKDLEEKLLQTQKSIVRSEFLSQVSHELRTPMNSIMGFSQVLKFKSQNLNEQQKFNIEKILLSGNHMVSLIDELLDLTQVESGQCKVLSEIICVDKLIHECTLLMQPQIQEKKILLINNFRGKGQNIQADFKRLKQVILNLLSNAIKYNHMCGQIIIDSETTNKENFRLSIENTGKSLTQKQIKQLFMPFERANIINNVEGTGLGLAISKNLVQLMGGAIGIESTGKDSNTFWVEFKCADVPSTALEAKK